MDSSAPYQSSSPTTPIQQTQQQQTSAHYPINPQSQPPSSASSSASPSQQSQSRPLASREQMMTAFRERLIASGEKQKLKEQLKNKLVESQWRNAVISQCKAVMNANGLERTTLEMLVSQSLKVARENVPPHIKGELMENIRRSLANLSRRPETGPASGHGQSMMPNSAPQTGATN